MSGGSEPGAVRRWAKAWLRGRLERRVRRELAEVDGAPRLQVLPPWRARPSGTERQVFRAFVQINIAPRGR